MLCLVVVALKRRAARSREPKKTARRLIFFFFKALPCWVTFRKLFGNVSDTFAKLRKRFGNVTETFRKLFGNFSVTFRKLFGNFSETFGRRELPHPLAGANETPLAEFISQARVAVFLSALKELHALSLYPKAPNLKFKPKLEVQTV